MIVQEMTPAECYKALAATSLGRLACARNNQPYVVPIYFVFDGGHIYGCEGQHAYGFSTLGQKIAWMRSNPLVCLEVDNVSTHNDWMSIIAFGRYQELPDTPEFEGIRLHALELLQKRAMWWQPATIALPHHDESPAITPVFYRIRLESVTGHRAMPDPAEVAATPTIPPRKGGSWLRHFLHPTRAKTPNGKDKTPA